jgi:hypothetical protein
MITDCNYNRIKSPNAHKVYQPLVRLFGEHRWRVLKCRPRPTATGAMLYAQKVRYRYNRMFGGEK